MVGIRCYVRAVDPDLELLERWRGGDATAGEQLFGKYFDSLCGFFATKCNDIDELVQRTLVACLNAKEQFRQQSTFRTYVFTVARHELYHYMRKLQRDEARFDVSTVSVAELITTPATRLARDAERRRIVEILRTLPLEMQTLLELHYWEDMDMAALAEVFETTPGNIRVRLHRARNALKDKAGIESL